MIYEKFSKITEDRIVASLIGMPKAKFTALDKSFEEADHAIQQQRVMQVENKHLKLGVTKVNLDTYEKKLLFVPYYLKTYPTFDLLGFHFGFSGGYARAYVDRLLLVLLRSLGDLGVVPGRTVDTPVNFRELIDKYKDVVIDGVECACVSRRARRYRKSIIAVKKDTQPKSVVVSDLNRRILFLCYIVAGSVHDYTLMKTVFKPGLAWFGKASLWLDLGFLGDYKAYDKARIHLPHKKPRKSKSNPNPSLTPEQKKQNRSQAAARVVVEHAIGGLKSFHCLSHRIRNHLDSFVDYFFALSTELWNYKIS